MGLRGVALLFVALVGLLEPLAVQLAPSTVTNARPRRSVDRRPPADINEEGLQRLQELLGLPAPTFGDEGRPARQEVPDFMLQLQRRVAHPDGVLRMPLSEGTMLPHDAKVVRSFSEQEPTGEQYLRFNVSSLTASELVLGAELRIFRLRRSRVPLMLHVYQISEGRSANASADEHHLLGVQSAPPRARPGWHSFNVLPAVNAWLAGDAPNLGLLVTATTLDGTPARSPAFARRGQHAPRHQPILVLYDGDMPSAPAEEDQNPLPPGRHPHTSGATDDQLEDSYEDEVYEEEDDNQEVSRNSANEDGETAESDHRQRSARSHRRQRRDSSWTSSSSSHRRERRQTAATSRNMTRPLSQSDNTYCTLRSLWVDFERIGWSSWIISPIGYNAYQCVGKCPYPLGRIFNPTNHATVQSTVHGMKLEETNAPCCAPRTLRALSILFTDRKGEVILKLYEDMVAASCACL